MRSSLVLSPVIFIPVLTFPSREVCSSRVWVVSALRVVQVGDCLALRVRFFQSLVSPKTPVGISKTGFLVSPILVFWLVARGFWISESGLSNRVTGSFPGMMGIELFSGAN